MAHEAPLSMGFSRQGHWSGLPFPPPEDLPNPGIKSTSPASAALQADSLWPTEHLQPGKLKKKERKKKKERNIFRLKLTLIGQE